MSQIPMQKAEGYRIYSAQINKTATPTGALYYNYIDVPTTENLNGKAILAAYTPDSGASSAWSYAGAITNNTDVRVLLLRTTADLLKGTVYVFVYDV